jgi:hypothetical protein
MAVDPGCRLLLAVADAVRRHALSGSIPKSMAAHRFTGGGLFYFQSGNR